MSLIPPYNSSRHTRVISTAGTVTTVVDSTATGIVTGMQLWNTSQSPVFMHLYDSASAPTVGSTTNAIGHIIIPGNVNGSGQNYHPPAPIKYSNGLSYTLTKYGVPTDATSFDPLSGNDHGAVGVNIDYVP